MNKLPDKQAMEDRRADESLPDGKAPEANVPEQEQSDEAQQAPEAEQTAETDSLSDPPRIWVGSLSDYNNGVLHGEWIDATQDEAEVYEQIAEMLAASPTTARYGDLAEEYGIFDHDNFCGLQITL